MATYYALTTHGQAWFPLQVTAATRREAEERARALIGPVTTGYGTDLYADTEHKNLRIVARSALRCYGWTPERLAERLMRMDNERAEMEVSHENVSGQGC